MIVAPIAQRHEEKARYLFERRPTRVVARMGQLRPKLVDCLMDLLQQVHEVAKSKLVLAVLAAEELAVATVAELLNL